MIAFIFAVVRAAGYPPSVHMSVHSRAPTCVSVRVPCAAARPVARLQDCVRAVCNKYARASGPEKIYHKQEGRQSAHGRKRMEKGVREGG